MLQEEKPRALQVCVTPKKQGKEEKEAPAWVWGWSREEGRFS
jgi:hypothetical protein